MDAKLSSKLKFLDEMEKEQNELKIRFENLSIVKLIRGNNIEIKNLEVDLINEKKKIEEMDAQLKDATINHDEKLCAFILKYSEFYVELKKQMNRIKALNEIKIEKDVQEINMNDEIKSMNSEIEQIKAKICELNLNHSITKKISKLELDSMDVQNLATPKMTVNEKYADDLKRKLSYSFEPNKKLKVNINKPDDNYNCILNSGEDADDSRQNYSNDELTQDVKLDYTQTFDYKNIIENDKMEEINSSPEKENDSNKNNFEETHTSQVKINKCPENLNENVKTELHGNEEVFDKNKNESVSKTESVFSRKNIPASKRIIVLDELIIPAVGKHVSKKSDEFVKITTNYINDIEPMDVSVKYTQNDELHKFLKEKKIQFQDQNVSTEIKTVEQKEICVKPPVENKEYYSIHLPVNEIKRNQFDKNARSNSNADQKQLQKIKYIEPKTRKYSKQVDIPKDLPIKHQEEFNFYPQPKSPYKISQDANSDDAISNNDFFNLNFKSPKPPKHVKKIKFHQNADDGPQSNDENFAKDNNREFKSNDNGTFDLGFNTLQPLDLMEMPNFEPISFNNTSQSSNETGGKECSDFQFDEKDTNDSFGFFDEGKGDAVANNINFDFF